MKSTVANMLTYVGAHLTPDQTTLAGPLREVQTPRFQVKKDRLAIGLGWLIVTRKDQTYLWHNGGTGGFSSFTGFNPTDGYGLVVLANARAGRAIDADRCSLFGGDRGLTVTRARARSLPPAVPCDATVVR